MSDKIKTKKGVKRIVGTLFLIIFLQLFTISMVSSLETLKPAKLNQEYLALQTCANCTFINITITRLTSIIVANVPLINNGSGTWTYNITLTNLGRHDMTGFGDIDGVDTSFATFFIVTPNGEEITSGQGILYFILVIVFFGLLLLLFYFVMVIPKENIANNRGDLVEISTIKYLRLFFIALLYPLTIILLNLLNGLAVNFSTLTMFSGIIGFLFETMLRGAWIFTVFMVLWVFYQLIKDSNIKKQIERLGRFRMHE